MFRGLYNLWCSDEEQIHWEACCYPVISKVLNPSYHTFSLGRDRSREFLCTISCCSPGWDSLYIPGGLRIQGNPSAKASEALGLRIGSQPQTLCCVGFCVKELQRQDRMFDLPTSAFWITGFTGLNNQAYLHPANSLQVPKQLFHISF